MPTPSRRRWFRFSLRSALIAIALLSLILACIGNLLHVYYAEQRVATEIQNAGGGFETSLFGHMPSDSLNGWEEGPRLFHWVVFVRLSGTDIGDKKLARLQLRRFTHLQSLSFGYDAVFGIDGPKWEAMPAPITDEGLTHLPPFPKLRSLNLWDLPIGDSGLEGLGRKAICCHRFAIGNHRKFKTARPGLLNHRVS
ncbi:MAG: hypothetical protein O3C40_07095 [Planctomycetota bacterium]|nr:hypothetical protein [Planctomycetota bacterium]